MTVITLVENDIHKIVIYFSDAMQFLVTTHHLYNAN